MSGSKKSKMKVAGRYLDLHVPPVRHMAPLLSRAKYRGLFSPMPDVPGASRLFKKPFQPAEKTGEFLRKTFY